MRKDLKKLAEIMVKEFQELDRNGEVAKAGNKVAAAIKRLRKEREISIKVLNRKY